MLFINRLLISLLFLMFSFLSYADTAGGTNSYTYWKSYPNHFSAGQQCKESLTALCSSAFGGFKTTNQSCTTDTVECKEEYYGTIILNNTCRTKDQWGVETGTTYHVQEGYSNITYYNKQTHTCPAGQHLKLDGCNVSCEIDNPCMDKKDQEKELEEICGLSVCPAGSSFSQQSQVCKKPNGATVPAQSVYDIPAAGKISSFDGCEVVSQPSPDAIGRGYYKITEMGGGELTTYCPVKYKYTGNKGTDADGSGSGGSGNHPNLEPAADTENQPVADLPKLPPNMYYPPTGGSCNAGDAQGTYGAGESEQPVCVKQSGNNGDGNGGGDGLHCLDGSPIPTTGTCPDNGGDDNPNPTTCPNNAPKNADGTCPTSTGGGGGGGGDGDGDGTYTESDKCLRKPACSGDVVQCGLINQQWRSNCDLQEALIGFKEADGKKYEDVGKDSTDARVAAASGLVTQKINEIKGFLVPSSSGSCPSDISISLMGKNVTLPVSRLCPLFQLMRFLLHLIVNLLCLRILYSSFIRV